MGDNNDALVLATGAGELSLRCAYAEALCRELVPALDQVVVLAATPHRAFAVALCTLRLGEDLAGRLLGDAALALAERSGSKANTLLSARSCAAFRAGVAREFKKANFALASAGFPECQVRTKERRRRCSLPHLLAPKSSCVSLLRHRCFTVLTEEHEISRSCAPTSY